MDRVAYQLAVEERERLQGLTTLSVATAQQYLERYNFTNKELLIQAIKESPDLIIPYLELASTSAENYYTTLRQIAEVEDAYSETQNEITRPVYDRLYGGTGEIANKVNIGQLDDFDTVLIGVNDVFDSAIFTQWRSVLNAQASNDSVAAYVNVITSPNACAWCLWLKQDDFIVSGKTRSRLVARSETQGGGKANFHDNCNCVYGVVFEQEDADKYVTAQDVKFRETLNNIRSKGVSGQQDIMRALREAGYK